jgi:hypothetical protein
MNSASKHAVTALLVFSITGCAPKNANTAPPVQAQAPTLATGKAGAMYPPPLTESQTETQPATPPPAPVVAQTQPAPTQDPAPPPSPKKSSSHKTKPSAAKPAGSDSGSTQTGAAETPSSSGGGTATTDAAEVAANAEPPAASPIGQLTPADTPETAQKGKDTGDLIAKTEDGLSTIKRPLNTQEQETVTQIKAFLTKARTALTNQDYDGAFILATKAKVLLDELNKT